MNFDESYIYISYNEVAVSDSNRWEVILEVENEPVAKAVGSTVREALSSLAIWIEDHEDSSTHPPTNSDIPF